MTDQRVEDDDLGDLTNAGQPAVEADLVGAAAGAPRDALQPVILGGDIGAYSLARACYEGFGVRSTVISAVSSGLLRHSKFLTHVVEPKINDENVVVRRLRQIAMEGGGKQRILMGSADSLIRTLVQNRDQIEDLYTIPYTSLDRLDLVTDKEMFGKLCAELGIAHPRTVVHDVGLGGEPDTSELTFPVVAKTADTAAYAKVNFAGKRKVFTVHSRHELAALLRRIREADYKGKFLIQDSIPGDDSGMRILTCYSDQSGKVQFAAFGHVLLEEHTPGALGNPAGIITESQQAVVEQARRLLEHIGWTGYANFDLKYDPRDGRYVFFELNPRLGRSNFYITAAGQNPIELYVREHLDGLDPLPPDVARECEQRHLYTVLPKRLLLRYIADPALRARARTLYRDRQATNPLWSRAERDPRRIIYLALAQLNQYRKYRIHYPLTQARSAEERA